MGAEQVATQSFDLLMELLNAPILLVEDNDEDAYLMERAIKDAGIAAPFRSVKDGESAISYLAGTGRFADRTAFPLPGVIFLDLKLPLISGLDVLQWIRRNPNLSKIIVIVVTASQEPVELNRGYQLGANSIIVKPASTDRMIELAHAFKLWGHRRELGGEMGANKSA